MKKTLLIIFLFITFMSFGQNVTITGPPTIKIYSAYGIPSFGIGQPGDLWSSGASTGSRFWQNFNRNWYTFFITRDTNDILATKSYVNGHSGGTSGWLLAGNTGTNPNFDFCGTTDNKTFSLGSFGKPTLLIDSQGFIFAGLDPFQPSLQLNVSGGFQTFDKVSGFNTLIVEETGGNVGIGIGNPSAILHVVGTLRFVTGNEGAGKFLQSDANGNADWADITTTCFDTIKAHVFFACSPMRLAADSVVTTGNLNVNGSVTATFSGADLTGTRSNNITVAKLNGQLPAYYLDRANQTGTQTASTISDFAATVNTDLSALNIYTTPTLAQGALGSGKPYILSTTIGVVNVLLLSITP